jgi:hypothetical protein
MSDDLIELRFTPRNEELIRLGLKRATTRRSEHGEVGSTFLAAGKTWMIRSIVSAELGPAAETFHLLEGEPSADYFLQEWARCYGLERVDPDQQVYVHIFAEAPPQEPSQ